MHETCLTLLVGEFYLDEIFQMAETNRLECLGSVHGLKYFICILQVFFFFFFASGNLRSVSLGHCLTK